MIIIINGQPRTGKSAFVQRCKLVSKPQHIYEYSTVDFIKYLADECGWDGIKRPKDRKFLSDLKDLLTEWGDVPFKQCIKKVNETYDHADYFGIPHEKTLIFIHCREPHEIQKFVDYYGSDKCKTLLIRRPTEETNDQSNHADAQVFDYRYDEVIINDRDLDYLEELAEEFVAEKIGVDALK